MRLRLPTIGALTFLVIGAICISVTTSRGMLAVQSLAGFSETFSVGRATITRSESWLLLSHRERQGDPQMKLGFLASRENVGVPKGRYFSFEDIKRFGYVTFIDIDEVTVAQIGRTDIAGLNCHPIEKDSGRRLVMCRAGKNQVLIYDLNRFFVAGISPAEGELFETVLSAILK